MKFIVLTLFIVLLFTQSQCFLQHKSTTNNATNNNTNTDKNAQNTDSNKASDQQPQNQDPALDSYAWTCLENELVICKNQFTSDDFKVLASSNASKVEGAIKGLKLTSKFSEVATKFTALAKLFDSNLKNESSQCVNRVVDSCKTQQLARS